MMNRDEMRWITGLRNDGIATKDHLHNKLGIGNDDLCDHCGCTESVSHLMEHCTKEKTMEQRIDLKKVAEDLYQKAEEMLKELQRRIQWRTADMDFGKMETLLFPPNNMPMNIRRELLLNVAAFGRKVIGYAQRTWDQGTGIPPPDVSVLDNSSIPSDWTGSTVDSPTPGDVRTQFDELWNRRQEIRRNKGCIDGTLPPAGPPLKSRI